MYAGRDRRGGRRSSALFARPRHPTRAGCCGSVPPARRPRRRALAAIAGPAPDLSTHCRPAAPFAPRCPLRRGALRGGRRRTAAARRPGTRPAAGRAGELGRPRSRSDGGARGDAARVDELQGPLPGPARARCAGRSRRVQAVDGVVVRRSGRGETLGLVGESGCGKTTTGAGDPAAATEPTAGQRLLRRRRPDRAARRARCGRRRRDFQMVFQDPYASLNPRMTVGEHRRRAARGARPRHAAERRARVARAARAGRPAGRRCAERYPHEFSRRPAAADRHRARAGASSPSFIVCDEPVSALDVSIQAQIINLLERPAGASSG